MSTQITAVLSPDHYIEKVDLATGEVMDGAIRPEELLVRSHRDYHVLDVYTRHLMSRMMRASGDADAVRQAMKEVRRMGHRASEILARAFGGDPDRIGRALFGLGKTEHFFRYKRHPLPADEIAGRLQVLKDHAEERLSAVQGGLRVLLTGGTGFVGKEIMWQAARDPEIAEMVVLIRPKEVRDRKTRQVVRVLSPEERGRALLGELQLHARSLSEKFRFVGGDIEEADLGVAEEEIRRLAGTLTHVIHCAASVAFDAPYDESYRANVLGTLNALAFSHRLQTAPGSPFVSHLSVETSYIHGRQVRQRAREDEIVFPRNFYNNYYELTKAMGSIETERFMLEKGLRVVQLCPAIVIGNSRTGNNRGDTKVVNAPVNAFGRARQHLEQIRGGLVEWSRAWVLYRMASVFPGDPAAELNLIPVDWVVDGILRALKRARAVGERVHLATDRRITAEEMTRICREELGADVRLAEPTLHRTVQWPVLAKVLSGLQQPRLANALEKLGSIFGGYSEWGQPVHEVGNDVEILGMPPDRPHTASAFRMLCRHNKYVQDFGKVKDPVEIARRERVWAEFVADLERSVGHPLGEMSAEEFREAVATGIDLAQFERESID